jgi:hypothetical protein
MSKHTPGPWYVDHNDVMGHGVVSRTKIISLYNGNRDWRANAALIAAAPDLLIALKELVSEIYQSGMVDMEDILNNDSKTVCEIARRLELAEVAIKKAETQ